MLMVGDGYLLYICSCDQVECGPNWSDWGEPDEHDITQTLPAEFSSDKEHPLRYAGCCYSTSRWKRVRLAELMVDSPLQHDVFMKWGN